MATLGNLMRDMINRRNQERIYRAQQGEKEYIRSQRDKQMADSMNLFSNYLSNIDLSNEDAIKNAYAEMNNFIGKVDPQIANELFDRFDTMVRRMQTVGSGRKTTTPESKNFLQDVFTNLLETQGMGGMEDIVKFLNEGKVTIIEKDELGNPVQRVVDYSMYSPDKRAEIIGGSFDKLGIDRSVLTKYLSIPQEPAQEPIEEPTEEQLLKEKQKEYEAKSLADRAMMSRPEKRFGLSDFIKSLLPETPSQEERDISMFQRRLRGSIGFPETADEWNPQTASGGSVYMPPIKLPKIEEAPSEQKTEDSSFRGMFRKNTGEEPMKKIRYKDEGKIGKFNENKPDKADKEIMDLWNPNKTVNKIMRIKHYR